jgi:hypothetical protein
MRPRQQQIYSRASRSIVMAGLGPAIPVFVAAQDVDAREAQTSLRSLRKLDCGPAHDVASITPM